MYGVFCGNTRGAAPFYTMADNRAMTATPEKMSKTCSMDCL